MQPFRQQETTVSLLAVFFAPRLQKGPKVWFIRKIE